MKLRKVKSAPVGVIGKVLAILELINATPGGLKLRDIAERTDINKSTAHRFVSHLEAEGYLFRDALGTYTVGLKLTHLGTGVSFHASLAKMSRPILENLRKVTGETINLAVLDGCDVLYVDVLETSQTFRMVSAVGTRLPFYSTSLGKAIVAGLEDDQKRQELITSTQLTQVTHHTVTNISRLKKQLSIIRKRGFALDDEEAVAGIRCLGTAIRDKNGEAFAAISVSGPVVRITRERLPLFSQELCKAAREISFLLGDKSSISAERRR